jgi:hypothetical protein
VSVTLLQRSVSGEVEREWVSPADWSRALRETSVETDPVRRNCGAWLSACPG